jgi:hypothetical protein
MGYQIKEDEVDGACGTHGENRNAYRVLVVEHEGKRPLEGSRHRWEENIKVYVKETGYLWTVCVWPRIETGAGLL